MGGLVSSVVFLGALGLLGVTALVRLAPELDRSERVGYGIPLGATVGSLVLLLTGGIVGRLSSALVMAVGLAAVGCAALLLRMRRRPTPPEGTGIGLVPCVVLGLLVVRWAIYWTGALTFDADGLHVGSRYLYGDFAQHLGDVMSFAAGDNFPPQHPRFAGAPFAYHYLTSITSAALVVLGLGPAAALVLPGFLFSCTAALAVFAFARRATRDATAAALAVLLFFIGGGLGFWLSLRNGVWWDAVAQQEANFRWLNVFFALIAPQRAFLYGLPLGLLVVRLLDRAVDTRLTVRFVLAGVVAGLLPFAHLGALLALALATPVLFLAAPDRRWIWFFAAWVAVGAPQLWMQQGAGGGAIAHMRWAPGWVAAPDPWIWFWVKNVGLLLPLAIVGLAWPGFVARRPRRVLVALGMLFVAGNLIVFQPWDWDNTKVLVYAFLAACVVSSAVLLRAWRAHAGWRVPVVLALCSLLASGTLENVNQALGNDRHRLLDAEEVDLARRVREETGPDALLVCGLQHNHPVPVLSGRRVLLSYPAWHWSQGVDPDPRREEVLEILRHGERAEALLARYGVSYVVVGPWELEHGADADAYRARFPAPIRSERYEVFDVRSVSASSGTRSATRTLAR